jgi:hypothetical protein
VNNVAGINARQLLRRGIDQRVRMQLDTRHAEVGALEHLVDTGTRPTRWCRDRKRRVVQDLQAAHPRTRVVSSRHQRHLALDQRVHRELRIGTSSGSGQITTSNWPSRSSSASVWYSSLHYAVRPPDSGDESDRSPAAQAAPMPLPR